VIPLKKLLGFCAFVFLFVCGYIFTHNAPVVGKVADANAAHEIFSLDEAAEVTHACGKPLSVRDEDASKYGGPDAVKRVVKYRNVEFWFLKNSTDSLTWTLTGAFRTHHDDDLDTETIHQMMPCAKDIQFEVMR